MDVAEFIPRASLQDDHQVHHRGIHDLQSVPTQSEDRTSIPLLPSTECTADYENRHQVITKNIAGSKFYTVEIQ